MKFKFVSFLLTFVMFFTQFYDKRGNLIEGVYHRPGNPSEQIVEQYVYDATNRMVKGVNEKGEESHYIFNGLGYLVAKDMCC